MRELTLDCSFEPCNCTVSAPVAGGEAFCGASCRNADERGLESDYCPCGHPPRDEP